MNITENNALATANRYGPGKEHKSLNTFTKDKTAGIPGKTKGSTHGAMARTAGDVSASINGLGMGLLRTNVQCSFELTKGLYLYKMNRKADDSSAKRKALVTPATRA